MKQAIQLIYSILLLLILTSQLSQLSQTSQTQAGDWPLESIQDTLIVRGTANIAAGVVGQLIDTMKPNEPGWNSLRTATWGKAIYTGKPYDGTPGPYC